MQSYKSKSGKKSGVGRFEIGRDFIKVEFEKGEKYLYSYKSAGKITIEEMKKRALANEGLSTFISKNDPPFEKKY